MTDVSPSVAACMSDMASEILTLRARLAEVEAERDSEAEAHRHSAAGRARAEAERDARPTWDVFGDCLSQETKRRKAAEARLAEVEAERDLLRQAHERAEVHLGETQDRLAAAEARLAEVEALCDGDDGRHFEITRLIRAAARGEGDRG